MRKFKFPYLPDAAGTPLRFFTREAIFVVALFLCLLLVYASFRFAFLITYPREFLDAGFYDILMAFVCGARFDAAAISWSLIGILLLSHLPVIGAMRNYRIFWLTLTVVVVVLQIIILASDLQYFEHSKKHLGYEAIQYLNSGLAPVLQSALHERPVMFSVHAVLLVASGAIILFASRRADMLRYKSERPTAVVLSLLVIGGLMFIAARGGVQRVPIRAGDALISTNSSINTLTINSPFIVMKLIGKPKKIKLMDASTARAKVRSLVATQDDHFLSDTYPLLRSQGRTEPVRHCNVVLVVVESLTAKFALPDAVKLDATPEFRRLAQGGIVFDRFIATGYRTTNGVFSPLVGVPDRTERSVMMRPELMDNFGSLSFLLKKQGYSNLFIHGGQLDFDNLKNLISKERFDVIVGQNEMKKHARKAKTWGVDDEYIYERALAEFKRAKKPFFGFVLTLTSHSPYELPNDRFAIFKESDAPDMRYLNTLRYADAMLGEFFRKAEKEAYFDNTIFIITGDHTHHNNLDLYENQNVPLLIYAPKILSPALKHTIGSHVDIVPTVAGLLNLPYHAAFGKDLMRMTDDEGFAFFVNGTVIGWVEGNHIATMGLDGGSPHIYDFGKKDFSTDIGKDHPDMAKAIKDKAYAYYQFSDDLLSENRLFPPDDKLDAILLPPKK